MIALGGKMVCKYFYKKDENVLLQNYTIDIDKSLKKYKDIYDPYILVK